MLPERDTVPLRLVVFLGDTVGQCRAVGRARCQLDARPLDRDRDPLGCGVRPPDASRLRPLGGRLDAVPDEYLTPCQPRDAPLGSLNRPAPVVRRPIPRLRPCQPYGRPSGVVFPHRPLDAPAPRRTPFCEAFERGESEPRSGRPRGCSVLQRRQGVPLVLRDDVSAMM